MRGSTTWKPVPLISAAALYEVRRSLDKLYERIAESATDRFARRRENGRPCGGSGDLQADGSFFLSLVGTDLDLIVKYQAADASNTNAAYYEQRSGDEGAAGKVSGTARCVCGNRSLGRGCERAGLGTMLAMKDINRPVCT